MTASTRYTNRRNRFQLNDHSFSKSVNDSQRLMHSSPGVFQKSSNANSRETSGNASPHNSRTDTLASLVEEPTILERLSVHISQLDQIFQDIVDYKLDAEYSSTVAPSLAKSLQSSTDSETRFNLLSHIHKLAKNQASRCGLVTSSDLTKAVVSILQSTSNSRLQTESALIIQLLAKTENGARLINEELGIAVLVKMLRHPVEVIRTTALYALNQLMWYWPTDFRPEFRQNNGHFNLVQLLDENESMDLNWLLICLDTLRMAVYENEYTKLRLLETNLYDVVVRLLRTYSHNPKVVYNIARLLKVLSVCNANKTKLVEAGAVEALTPLLVSSNEAVQLEILWGLRNLSDQAYHLEMTKNLIPLLINLLTSKNEHISICAIGCLCNLTCRNAHNKDIFVKKGGVRLLCELLIMNMDRPEVVEPVCSALRHVTHRNTNATAAIYEIRTHNTLPTVVTILTDYDFMTTLPVIKSVVGLVRNVATEKESCSELSDLKISATLVRLLQKNYELIYYGGKTKTNFSLLAKHVTDIAECENYTVDGVSLVDMLELILTTLQTVSKNEYICEELIRTTDLLTIVVQLIYSSSTYLQRAATALLSQLSTSHSGCLAIQREGACPRLTELIQSDNEYIAAYSASVLHHISKDKPEEYRRRLSMELRQSLFDGGLLNENRLHNDDVLLTNSNGSLRKNSKNPNYSTTMSNHNNYHHSNSRRYNNRR